MALKYFEGAGGSGSGLAITDDTTSNVTEYPIFSAVSGGSITTAKVASTKLSFNPSTGTLSAQGQLDVSQSPYNVVFSDLGNDLVFKLSNGTEYMVMSGGETAQIITKKPINVQDNIEVEPAIRINSGGKVVIVNSSISSANNLAFVNFEEAGAGVSKGVAGIEVDRGSLNPYRIEFQESSQTFRVGEAYLDMGYTQTLLTFQFNEKVTGQTTGAVGYIVSDDGSTLRLKSVVNGPLGPFIVGETILGSSVGGTGTVDTLTYVDNTLPVSTSTIDPPYVQSFNSSTDWGAPSGGLYTITILGTTHGFGVNVSQVVTYETVGGDSVETIVDTLAINNSSGDVSISVTESPDGRFAGKVIIIEGQAVVGGSGVTTVGNINSETKSANGAVISGPSIVMQTADDTNIGLVGLGYQNFNGAKTNRNDSNGAVKIAGFYNADTTDGNGASLNFETNTTGAGAQTQFATTFLGVNYNTHNNATVSASAYWTTYSNGIQKTIWNYDATTGILTTDGLLSLNGDFTVNNGFISCGRTLDVLTGQGFNQAMNNLGGQISVPVTGPITGTNVFGTNLAQGFLWSEDMDGGAIPFLGVSAVGYVGYIAGLVSGKTMETINMAVAGLSDQGSVAGAVLTNLNMYTAGGLVGGTPATVTNMRMFYSPAGVGGVATNEWGLHIATSAFDNYIEKSLTFGGDGKTANPDTAIEIKSLKTIKLSSFTTTEKNAIATPEAGMILFDATLGKMCVYSGAAWETVTSV